MLNFLLGIRIVFFDDQLGVDRVFASPGESWLFVCIGFGFFIFEESTLIYFDIRYKTLSKELHLHHLVAVFGAFLTIYHNRGHYYAIRGFNLEFSTPFSCVCWCLLKLKLEKSYVWKINQGLLIYAFHFRTVYELHYVYEIYTNWTNVKQIPFLLLCNTLFGLILVTFWLTPYWTYRKTAQYFNPTDWNMEPEVNMKPKRR
ncbi:unnamed protein product [Didymodactylos carnosus]|uniref:TLC domain-containing protein n=1 Tax=Didymodactylos carnosus TaxID=1234261 RepID=A0A814HKC1_9BILA|nr:unnamed protein product [Didymodactylos carnosus]CAF1195908.1 unnamed protein product [Didymodactylos carnosus]CAF3783687.1 unnamed protein product [Didymodactylos carnosus]CAF4006178.1 unnamed protein product [Didymodactylos carnosus]